MVTFVRNNPKISAMIIFIILMVLSSLFVSLANVGWFLLFWSGIGLAVTLFFTKSPIYGVSTGITAVIVLVFLSFIFDEENTETIRTAATDNSPAISATAKKDETGERSGSEAVAAALAGVVQGVSNVVWHALPSIPAYPQLDLRQTARRDMPAQELLQQGNNLAKQGGERIKDLKAQIIQSATSTE